jgi:hypothetical protein
VVAEVVIIIQQVEMVVPVAEAEGQEAAAPEQAESQARASMAATDGLGHPIALHRVAEAEQAPLVAMYLDQKVIKPAV